MWRACVCGGPVWVGAGPVAAGPAPGGPPTQTWDRLEAQPHRLGQPHRAGAHPVWVDEPTPGRRPPAPGARPTHTGPARATMADDLEVDAFPELDGAEGADGPTSLDGLGPPFGLHDHTCRRARGAALLGGEGS